jgi:hypothetical protein
MMVSCIAGLLCAKGFSIPGKVSYCPVAVAVRAGDGAFPIPAEVSVGCFGAIVLYARGDGGFDVKPVIIEAVRTVNVFETIIVCHGLFLLGGGVFERERTKQISLMLPNVDDQAFLRAQEMNVEGVVNEDISSVDIDFGRCVFEFGHGLIPCSNGKTASRPRFGDPQSRRRGATAQLEKLAMREECPNALRGGRGIFPLRRTRRLLGSREEAGPGGPDRVES